MVFITKNICRGNNNGAKVSSTNKKDKIKTMNKAELLDIILKQKKEIDSYKTMRDESATNQMMTSDNLEPRDTHKLQKTDSVKNQIMDSNCEP